jgi:hypothetical protein
MAIAAPTQLATISSNTSGQTTWSTGAKVFPTNGQAVLGLIELTLSGYTATLGLSIADNLGNTWTIVPGATGESIVGSARVTTAIAYFLYPSAGTDTTATVTATFNSVNERMGWCGYTTGHDTTSPVDQSGNANTGTGVAQITIAVSSADTAAGDLSMVAMGLSSGSALTVTWPSSSGASYTSLANNADAVRHRNGAFEYQVLGAAGTESTTISYSGNASSVASIVTFKAAAAGGGGTAWTQSFSDTITLSDAIAKSMTAGKSDSFTLSDVFSRTVIWSRGFDDTTTLSDAISKAVGAAKADSVTLTDTQAKSLGLSKSDSITTSDSLAKSLGLSKSDTITMTDAVAKSIAHALADTITLGDVMTPTFTPGGGTNWVLNLADTITLSDALARTLSDAGATPAVANAARKIFLSRFGIY